MESISKAKVKQYAALSVKKYRYRHQRFVVEGIKMVKEALGSSWKVEAIVVQENRLELMEGLETQSAVYLCEESTFRQLSQLSSPEGIMAVVHLPSPDAFRPTQPTNLPAGPGLILEDVQDPGNMGTILRIADWFGFPQIICSKGCVDPLNVKTLRSSMGAIFRINLTYVDRLSELLANATDQFWVADMEGIPLAEAPLHAGQYLLLGNEANGVSEGIRNLTNLQTFHIPGEGGAESLNVAIAAAIGSWQLFQQKKA